VPRTGVFLYDRWVTYPLEKARKLAYEIFDRMKDWSDAPYTDHLEAVCAAMEPYDEDLQVVGMLHSIMEHTDWDPETLRYEGLPEKSIDTLKALTRDRRAQPWAMYFRQVRADEDATLVKIACTAHNYRAERLATRKLLQRSERLIAQGFAQRHLWTAAYEDDLRDVLEAVHPGLLIRVDQLKKDGKL